MSRTVLVSVIAKVHLDEDEIASAMEGDNDARRSESDAIYALALEAFHPAEFVDVKELFLHEESKVRPIPVPIRS